MKYSVIEVSELTVTPNGKELKKLILKGKDQSHLEERVTMWSDSPFWNCKVGDELQATVDKKDSGTPIPEHPGKNYINRNLVPETNENGTEKTGSELEARVVKIENWIKNQMASKVASGEEINPDDIPF